MTLLAELKRRNVLRVAALYGAMAWLLIQVTDVLTEPLGLPGWLLEVVIWLLAIGFPVVILIAWAFELTPDGLQRDSGAGTGSASKVSAGRKLDFAIIAALVAALGYFVATRPSDQPATAAQSDAGTAQRSLAVLPFASLSSSAEDGYFADGLTEELLNLLAGIEGLKVAGRTSSFYFKGRNEDLREIGRKLGVSHILEGSVRRSGQKLRITAQLVNADDGFHLWSKTYDRELTDVLAIQDEIGQSVADALEIRLMASAEGSRQLSRPPVNAEAYRLYLVARSKVRERGLENLRSAVRLFDDAATIDPAFAGAYAGKALALCLLWGNHGDGDGKTGLAEAERAARRALELDPASSEAYVALGRQAIESWDVTGEDRHEEAGRYLRKAVALDPQSTQALYWLGDFELDTNPTRAIELYDQVLELDPLEFMAASARAAGLLAMGRSDDARAEYERLVRVYPDSGSLLQNYAYAEMTSGRFSRALSINAQARVAGLDAGSYWMDARAYRLLGDMKSARNALMKMDGENPRDAWTRDSGLAVMDGDFARLLELDRKMLQAGGPAFVQISSFFSHMLNGMDAQAMRIADELTPSLTAETPNVPRDQVCAAPYVAFVQSRLGAVERARRLAATGLATWDASPAARTPEEHFCRVRLLGVAGRLDEAQAEFARAVDLGFRHIVDERFLSLHDDPTLEVVRGDPRFEAQMKRISDDLARQRAIADAWRKKAASS